jgi:hypothetical protein
MSYGRSAKGVSDKRSTNGEEECHCRQKFSKELFHNTGYFFNNSKSIKPSIGFFKVPTLFQVFSVPLRPVISPASAQIFFRLSLVFAFAR